MIQGSGDVETLRFGGNKDDPSVLAGVEKESFESCLVDFLTWTVSFKRQRSDWGKRVVYQDSSADPFWTRATLDMIPKDMVEAFVLNNIRVCLIYDLLRIVALKDIIF